MQLLSQELSLTLMRMREGGREQTCCCCSIHCLTNLLERLRKSFTSSSFCWIVGRSCRFIRSSHKIDPYHHYFCFECHRDATPGATAPPCPMISCRTRAQSLVQVLRGKLLQQHDNHQHDNSNYVTNLQTHHLLVMQPQESTQQQLPSENNYHFKKRDLKPHTSNQNQQVSTIKPKMNSKIILNP